ncbi:MAG: hypothetical protein EBV77_01995, partial [Gemmatimonadaceae bacterium]|nr:hypothetical protein [Gemmatimonadaceae bacterium]
MRVVAVLAALLSFASPLAAQTDTAVTAAELQARRAAFAERIGTGVVVAFGGRTLVHDFTTFYQLQAFRYLTELNEPDHAFVMVVKDKVPSTTLFLTKLEARRAFYYGQSTDSANSVARTGLPGRAYESLWGVLDSLAATGLPFYHIPDVETMDFSSADTLTRGQEAIKLLTRKHPQLTI